MHEIRFCNIDEYSLLINFIDKNWKKDHIFTRDKKLLDWQHLSKENNRYNFVVAYNKETEEFDAILGFIPLCHYDKDLQEYNEIWLAIWKVKDSMSNKVSGIQLLFYLNSKLKPKTICSVGITEEVRSIYDAFKYKRGFLKHFYITSSNYKSNISNIKHKVENKVENKNYEIKEISFEENIEIFNKIISRAGRHIVKSATYISNRFIKHPTYKYKIYGIFIENQLKAFFISRKITVNNSSVIRIVDYYGDFINDDWSYEFQELLFKENAEYLDLLCHINDDEKIKKMGFIKKAKDDIIPEYFEPLVQKNIQIEFAYKSKDNICIFKADSDQDRPTQILSEKK